VSITTQSDPVLAKYAVEIRRLGKRVKEDVIAIGRYLDQAQKHAGRGAWLTWIETEFGWSDQTAYRFIHLYQAQQNPEFHKLWNSDLTLSSLYQLAAPKTPDGARIEIADRLEAGEKVSPAAVNEVIAQAKNAGKAAETGETEDPSIEQRRLQHAALFAEPSDSVAPETTPKPETLIEHWRRSPGELTALLDAVGVAGILEGMSAEFGRQLRARLPAPRRKSGKPFKHTMNLKADSARNGRGTHSRH
jgi:hypothetical protein